MIRDILFYKTSDGKCPIQDFLDSLPSKAAKKAAWVLLLIKEFDKVPVSYFKKLPGTEEIWECRVASGSNEYRIFSFYHKENIVLTNGCLKKSQRNPRNEIKKAENYRRDFLKRRVKK